MISHDLATVKPTTGLTLLTTRDHAYTVRHWPKKMAGRGIKLHVLHWEQALTATRIPNATCVMTDFDRLSMSELEAAAHLARHLEKSGVRVLNDPSRFLGRAALIRSLYEKGINPYTCYLPAFSERPTRFPVFLRTLASHRGVLSDLLRNPTECAEALTGALERGHPIADLAFIEFAGAPIKETGNYRKLSAYRVGDRIVRASTVNDTYWMAKSGIMGLATDEEYRQERDETLNYPLSDQVMKIFDMANCEFGRLDFALVDGRYVYYEINTNPYMAWTTLEHANPYRMESMRLTQRQLIDAFEAISVATDSPWISLREKRARLVRQ